MARKYDTPILPSQMNAQQYREFIKSTTPTLWATKMIRVPGEIPRMWSPRRSRTSRSVCLIGAGNKIQPSESHAVEWKSPSSWCVSD